ncbi:pyridoxal-dependent decarboxylase [uncultured Aliiroseovarius sp.]|uniref:pyridoxal phosphate-dependent decarboxylase family protein n=1 Tax=uncultured Aliiroseovarius sp. TaxID=1658783 RepID=UPI00260F065C|nr:pyridoxal-dependent decarboxylase [uncultured Aliiroseovarius sp.]
MSEPPEQPGSERQSDGAALTPDDWEAFRNGAHQLLDRCINQMRDSEDHPWQAPPSDIAKRYAIGPDRDLLSSLTDDVLPFHGGNTHPKFWGWVQGSGLASDLLAGMVTATLNANLGGRHHGANEMERAVVDWTRQQMGFGPQASGVLVTGSSQATVIALHAARVHCQPDTRSAGSAQGLTVYAGEGVHNATLKAVELLGLGRSALRLVPQHEGAIDTGVLRQTIAQDTALGLRPMAIVATAGSVDTGSFDDLSALADTARDTGVWLHVDGAFGAWTRLAADPWHALTNGIERADSIALDFHKWMYVGYDCAMALLADKGAHRAAFATRPAYLKGAEGGLAAGEPWFCDYGTDLSRGNRALRVWCALQMFGRDAFCTAITRNCAQAKLMADLVEARGMELMAPVVSNVCVFNAAPHLPADEQSALNSKIATALQIEQQTVFSTTTLAGVTCLRAAITNHRTDDHHIREAINAVQAIAQAVPSP